MSILNPSLKEFIQLVPVCPSTAGISQVLEIFSQQECDRLVVINSDREPLGIIRLQSLLPQCLGNTKVKGRSMNGKSTHFSSLSLDPYIKSLTILPAHYSLNEFWLHLKDSLITGLSQDLAIVDSSKHFLGLIDSWSLLKYLAANQPQPSSNSDIYQSEDYSPKHNLTPLINFLEKLPLPLRLQTDQGQVISQNFSWSQQLGELSEPLEDKLNSGDFKEEIDQLTLSSLLLNNFELGRKATYYDSEQVVEPNLNSQNPPQRCYESPEEIISSIQTKFTNNHQICPPLNISLEKKQFFATFKNNQEKTWQLVRIQLADFSLYPDSKLGKNIETDNINSHCQAQMLKISFKAPQLILVIAQDVTEQQQVTKELAAKNADLTQLSRLKDEFLACISHELKTPLTAILGLSTLLKDQLLGQLNERQSRYSQLIHQSGRQLMNIINDILDLTRMETGQMELNLEPINIAQVCDRAYLQAQQRRSTKSNTSHPEIHFVLDIEPGLDTIVADELRLCQMLVNLLSNALKFTQLDGEIGLKVRRWDGWIAFTVWDTGIGIPSQKQHLIFQKFQQLENPLTRQFEGTGLGLFLTQRLARLHGGDVSFISKVGQGSQFTLLLPPNPIYKEMSIGKLPIGITKLSLINSQRYTNRLVLIVDAVPQYIEKLSANLTDLGYQVMIARSGMEALEKVRRLQPRLVLLNPVLPILSGWDVLTLLKSDAQTKHIPILVTATQAEKELAYQNKADGFLTIPVQKEALRKSLTSLTKPFTHTNNCLTVLRLLSSLAKNEDLKPVLEHPINYRVLEVDDFEQAELMAHIWHPHVILVDVAELADPVAYMRQLSQYISLASLPLVTRDLPMTQAANQVTGLSVFPYLTPIHQQSNLTLWQAIEVAAVTKESFAPKL